MSQNFCKASVFTLLEGLVEFIVYCEASVNGLGEIPLQRGRVIPYAFRQLKLHEARYLWHDLQLGAMVFAFKIWRHYLYMVYFTIYTDHKSLIYLMD